MSSPLPKSPKQTDKSQKYDRQIRLWGEHGQNLLENARICLVNATPVGCEVLKNLVLPCIGGFTILDGAKVSEVDMGVNFFLDETFLGKSKALACMTLLQEMNTEVKGEYVDESIDFIFEQRCTFFDNFDIVVASGLNETQLVRLSSLLWQINVPLVYCRSLGFYGAIRLQYNEHCIIELHPDVPQSDLRIEKPFAALKQYLENTEINNKMPWLLVLYKFLQQWSAEHSGQIPSTFKEKTELRTLIQKAITNPDHQENYEQAAKAVNTVFGSGQVSNNLKAVFNDDACNHLNKQGNLFWIMCRALRDFVEKDNNGYLPVSGVVPDMTAESNAYIQLQNIYRQQALLDAEQVYRKCQSYLRELALPEEAISLANVRLFCREAAGLTVLRGTQIAEEKLKGGATVPIDELEVQGTHTEQYIAFRAYERFISAYNTIPGETYVEKDNARLKTIAGKLLSDWSLPPGMIGDDMIHEICRLGGCEVPSISAFIGGCAAHEIIKLITKQYKPIDNIFLYNGINASSLTMRL